MIEMSDEDRIALKKQVDGKLTELNGHGLNSFSRTVEVHLECGGTGYLTSGSLKCAYCEGTGRIVRTKAEVITPYVDFGYGGRYK